MSLIAILSDTHDQIANLRAAVRFCSGNDVAMLIHCGDLISPFMLSELDAFDGPCHLIYGNNIGDQHLISSRCSHLYHSLSHHGSSGCVAAFGLRIGFVHFPEMAQELARSGDYDVVCYGHDHRYNVDLVEKTLLINPGHLLGENDQAGFALLDCERKTVQRIRVGESMFNKEVRVIPV